MFTAFFEGWGNSGHKLTLWPAYGSQWAACVWRLQRLLLFLLEDPSVWFPASGKTSTDTETTTILTSQPHLRKENDTEISLRSLKSI